MRENTFDSIGKIEQLKFNPAQPQTGGGREMTSKHVVKIWMSVVGDGHSRAGNEIDDHVEKRKGSKKE